MATSPKASFSQMAQVFAVVLALTCLLAGVNSYSLFDPPCTKNPIGRCLAGVDSDSSNMEFCSQARSAMLCIGRVLHVCFTRNDPALLEDLSMIDVATFYEKQRAMCD